MTEEKTATIPSGKVTFTPSKEGNSCTFRDCESEYVRVEELDSPERLYCYKHCTTKKRDKYR